MVVLNTIRDWTVEVIWKKSLTKCFCHWMRCRECHSKKFKGFFDSRVKKQKRDVIPCQECKFELKNNEVDFWTHTDGCRNYAWKSNSKAKYIKWFNKFYFRHLPIRGDVDASREAGIDCIRRSIGASTWAWDNGSRLYF